MGAITIEIGVSGETCHGCKLSGYTRCPFIHLHVGTELAKVDWFKFRMRFPECLDAEHEANRQKDGDSND